MIAFKGKNISSITKYKMLYMHIFFKANQEKSKPDDIMESTTDAADWKMEVERVLPQLKVTIRTDNKVGSTMHLLIFMILMLAGKDRQTLITMNTYHRLILLKISYKNVNINTIYDFNGTGAWKTVYAMLCQVFSDISN